MSVEPHRRTRDAGTRPRATTVVADLVARGLVDPRRADEAEAVVSSSLGLRAAAETPLRRRLAEVAGYIGGALVVAAAVVFLTEQWVSLSTVGRVASLAVIALALFGAAVGVVVTGRTSSAGRAGESAVRRRLASALGCGGAVALAFAVGVLVEDLGEPFSSAPWFAGSVVLLCAALAAYRFLAASTLGQVTAGVAAASAIGSGLDTFFEGGSEIALGLSIGTLGVAWLVLAERDVWSERMEGLVLGCFFLVVGAQIPVLGSDHEWVGYALTALVAAAAVVLYTRTRSVPYLVAAVAGITIAVPEAMLDWTDGAVGPVGVLLATGLTLLVASLLGLRLRQEVGAAG